MSSSRVNLEKFQIPPEEILLATKEFSEANRIADKVYKGKLSERYQNRTAAFRRLHTNATLQENQNFLNQMELISMVNHKNIIPFIGYCNERIGNIAVYEHPNNGSLDYHLHDPNRRRFLTWAQRLEICIGVARGLEYLHSGLGDNRRLLHNDMKSANILLDDKLEPKISGFDLSPFGRPNQPQVHKKPVIGRPVSDEAIMPLPTVGYIGYNSYIFSPDGDLTVTPIERAYQDTNFYFDPIYKESSVLNTESNVYSFGIILFEMLSGVPAYLERVIGDDPQPQRLINLVRRYYADGVDNLIDPLIKDQINIDSLLSFKEIAYRCISWNLNDRPDMSTIISRILEALDLQKQGLASLNTTRSPQSLEGFRIPLEELKIATKNFNTRNCIGKGGFSMVYVGRLSVAWQNRMVAIKRINKNSYRTEDEFYNELEMVSNFQHQNIITFVGYCNEDNEMISVYDYAINGSIDRHIRNNKKMQRLTWTQRMKICLGVARGLKYLHWGLGWKKRIIHRDIKSANILLDDNMEAKISDFGLSLLVDQNQPQVYVPPAGTDYYIDPVYRESGILKIESDVFSFGVVMLEMISGTFAHQRWSTSDEHESQTLVKLVRSFYGEEADFLIDPAIRDEIDIRSFHVFIKIACRCISYNLKDRPTMKWIIRRIEEALETQTRIENAQGATSTILTRSVQHPDHTSFQIPLSDIIFSREAHNCIGDGGFGKVYKGQLSTRLRNCKVAIKCLDPNGHQGKKEFLTEVELISSFHHQNIIPFVGYCDKDDEMIIISKYATSGSLDHHLGDPSRRNRLTWQQRLKICLGAAKGLDYLHSGLGKHRVIHRDVKSANILLDEEMEAKLCDFGLSKKRSVNHHNQIFTKAAGIVFYLDPVYQESGILSKESDVYSFGVVLFEILSGRLAYHQTNFLDGKPEYLIILVRRYYNHEPKKLIDPIIKDEIDSQCFDVFIKLAYQCISFKSEERPTMETIVDGIEDAMDFQKLQV